MDYLTRFDNKSLNSRMGYILEELSIKNIKVPLPNTYIRLNNEKPKNNIKNKRWRIIINDDIKEEEIV